MHFADRFGTDSQRTIGDGEINSTTSGPCHQLRTIELKVYSRVVSHRGKYFHASRVARA